MNLRHEDHQIKAILPLCWIPPQLSQVQIAAPKQDQQLACRKSLKETVQETENLASLRRLIECLIHIDIILHISKLKIRCARPNVLRPLNDFPDQKRRRKEANHDVTGEEGSSIPIAVDEHLKSDDQEHNESADTSVDCSVGLEVAFVWKSAPVGALATQRHVEM